MTDRPIAVIMAAGHGTRMRSATPKVLHPVCGRPMVHWVIAAARESGVGRIVCVTRPDDGVADALPEGIEAAEQTDGEGTAAALLAARDRIDGAATVLALSGDHPMVSPELLRELAEAHEGAGAGATVLTTDELDPTGYGRVIRAGDGSLERIVETKSTEGLSEDELSIREINMGTYAFRADALLEALDEVGEERGERYLTAVFPVLRRRGHAVAIHPTRDTEAAIGVNSRVGLMAAEAVARRRIVERHALAGVSFHAPETVLVDADVAIGRDTEIGPGVVVRGRSRVGSGCVVGPHATIVDSEVGDRVRVAHSHLMGCRIAEEALIGPFSYVRPGAEVEAGAKVGAFVEVKNSRIGRGAKVPHLSYIGDTEVGAEANLGAGTITANYDGRRKHRTVIGDRARTGVHTSLLAPVRVGDDAYTGAGSVVTDDVPDGALGIARPRQRNVEGYAKRVEQRER